MERAVFIISFSFLFSSKIKISFKKQFRIIPTSKVCTKRVNFNREEGENNFQTEKKFQVKMHLIAMALS